jgi:hypothetical protein
MTQDKMAWKHKAETDLFEFLDAELDRARSNQTDWLVCLQAIRARADECYDAGTIAEYQWRVLINKSARIQDERNGDV